MFNSSEDLCQGNLLPAPTKCGYPQGSKLPRGNSCHWITHVCLFSALSPPPPPPLQQYTHHQVWGALMMFTITALQPGDEQPRVSPALVRIVGQMLWGWIFKSNENRLSIGSKEGGNGCRSWSPTPTPWLLRLHFDSKSRLSGNILPLNEIIARKEEKAAISSRKIDGDWFAAPEWVRPITCGRLHWDSVWHTCS